MWQRNLNQELEMKRTRRMGLTMNLDKYLEVGNDYTSKV